VTFSRLGSIPRWETMYPNSMPRGTPKTHFSGFSLTPLARRQSNATRRSLTRSSAFLVLRLYRLRKPQRFARCDLRKRAAYIAGM
jgi:hypothetical protein